MKTILDKIYDLSRNGKIAFICGAIIFLVVLGAVGYATHGNGSPDGNPSGSGAAVTTEAQREKRNYGSKSKISENYGTPDDTEYSGENREIPTEDTEAEKEKLTEDTTEKRTEKITEKQTEKVTEKETEKETEKKTEKVTERAMAGDDGIMVWVPTGGGQKYHSKPSYSRMKNPRQVSLSETKSERFTPCGRCY